MLVVVGLEVVGEEVLGVDFFGDEVVDGDDVLLLCLLLLVVVGELLGEVGVDVSLFLLLLWLSVVLGLGVDELVVLSESLS